MSFRKHTKGGNLFSAIEHQQKVSKKEVGILKLKSVIEWESFRPVLEKVTGYDIKDWSKGGNLHFDPLLMFKILILQHYHGLSDEATEEQITDRLSSQSFLDYSLEMMFQMREASGTLRNSLKKWTQWQQ